MHSKETRHAAHMVKFAPIGVAPPQSEGLQTSNTLPIFKMKAGGWYVTLLSFLIVPLDTDLGSSQIKLFFGGGKIFSD